MSLNVAVRRKWKGFSLDVAFQSNSEMLGILGASGSGKSMTLKCIAGVETPSEGKISVGNSVLFDSSQKINVKPQQRKIGYLFQNYALFPNMTVEDNIGCALGQLKENKQKVIDEMIRRFRLGGLEKRYPGQLSGGQQQRVALARILAYEPNVLLLDEPFSALDFYLKEQLQLELMDFLKEYKGDVVMVTHSRDEVYHLCKQLIVLEHGRCIAAGNTRELFYNPGLLTVARLTGCKNYSRIRKTSANTVFAEDWGIPLTVTAPIPEEADYVGIRAHDFYPATEGDINSFRISVRETLESPFEWNVLFGVKEVPESRTIWWMLGKERYDGGMPELLAVRPEHVLLLRSDGQEPD